MADNILSYIDQLNPTSALIGASNMLLNRLQSAGVVPRPDGSYAPKSKRTNTAQDQRTSRRGTAFRDNQTPVTGGMFQRGRVYGDLDAVAPVPGQGMFQRGRVYGDLNAVAPEMRSAPQTAPSVSIGQQPPVDTGAGKSRRQDGSTGPTSLDPRERAYVEEVSRLAQQAQTDPYFQQMQQYEAARSQGAPTVELGRAISAAKFGTPEQRMQQTVGSFNPLMVGMPGYPATRQEFEQQRPFIAPEEEARIDAMDMASQALQGAMQGQAGMQFPSQGLGVMQRPTGVSPNTSAFAGPQAGQAGMSMSPTTDISALPEETKAEFLKRLQSFRPM